MIFAASTNKKLSWPLILILILALIVRILVIPKLFPFDFDQEVAANAAYDFFANHKVSLIGQELSFEGFFLGPLHNWVQFIPYGLCRLQPDCTPYFYALISIFTLFFLHLVVKKLFNSRAAVVCVVLAGFSFAQINYEIGVNSNYFLLPSAIVLIYCLHRYFNGENRFLVLGSFVAGVAIVNFNPIFIFTSVTYFLFAFFKKQKSVRIFLLSLVAFFANYLPLVLFNARHSNILLQNLQEFVAQNAATGGYLQRFILLSKTLLGFYTNFLFNSPQGIFKIITLLFLVWFIYDVLKFRSKIKLFLLFWIIINFLGFLFYSGSIPDYYFLPTILPFIIIVSHTLKNRRILFTTFIALFLYQNINGLIRYQSQTSYQIKKQAINYVATDTKLETFNIYFGFSPGVSTGFPYLLKVNNLKPQERSKNRYFLTDLGTGHFKKTFPDKKVDIKSIGFIKIVSVK